MNTRDGVSVPNTISLGHGDVAIGYRARSDGCVEVTFGIMDEPLLVGTDTLNNPSAQHVDYRIVTDNLQSMQVLQRCVDAAVNQLQAMQQLQQDV